MTAAFQTGLVTAQGSAPPPHAPHDYPSRELTKGEVLYRLNDEAQAIYRVEEGLVKLSVDLLSGRERILTLAGPGDLIGAVIPTPRYGDSAEALSAKVCVSVIPREEAEKLQGELYLATGAQLVRLKGALEDTELPMNARLARTLLRLGERFGHTTAAGRVHLTLPLTHDNLAAMVGAARETTTATLSEMRGEGVISGTRGSYSFHHGELSDYAVTASQ